MSGRVWIVSELYFPEENATGRILTDIAEAMAQTFDVSVICAQPTYDARGMHASAHEKRNGVDIHRVWSTTLDKNNLAFRYINGFTMGVSFRRAARRLIGRGEAVLVVTNPPSLPEVIQKVCAEKGAACGVLVHDMYPEVLVPTGMLREDSKPYKWMAGKSRTTFGAMDRIVAIGRDMKDLLEKKMPGLRRVPEVITNYAEVDVICPVAREKCGLLKELGIEKSFVVQYAGNIGRTHGIETIASAAEELASEDTHFLFLGTGAKRFWLERHKTANMTITGYRPRQALNDVLNACDIALISFVPNMAGISVPSRMYNIMAAGKPIVAVADEDSEVARVVREEQVGWVVKPDDDDALVTAIREAKRSPEKLREMGQRARAAAEGKYARDVIMDDYRKLFREMLGASK